MLDWGPAGNVFAYNYSTGNYDDSAPNVLMQDWDGNHGAHPQFNLYEGNGVANFRPDNIWGSSSHGTAFRNWVKGTTKICNPTGNTRAPVDWNTCHWATQGIRAIGIEAWDMYYNLVGNVVGSDEMLALPGSKSVMALWPQNRPYQGAIFAYSFGYGTVSDDGTQGYGHSLSYSTVFIHGDYNNVDNTVIWANGVTQILPPSFYLSSKPSWFGSIPWPAMGPDVTGGIGPGGHAYAIPAQACYNNTAKDSNGLLIFNAGSCYGSSPGDIPFPSSPKNLRIR
jgi:hypothetical protein